MFNTISFARRRFRRRYRLHVLLLGLLLLVLLRGSIARQLFAQIGFPLLLQLSFILFLDPSTR